MWSDKKIVVLWICRGDINEWKVEDVEEIRKKMIIYFWGE